MLPSINELLYRSLSSDIAQMRDQIQSLLTRAERSEVTGGFAGLTLAQLPLTHNTGGDMYFATDGCKPGEATGHGTGTLVFWDIATLQWLRAGDYQPPSGGTPLPVASGGTGVSTLTAHAMLIGNGASPVLGLAPGTNRNVSISNGTDWISRALVAADLPVGGGSPLTTKGDLYGYDTAANRVPVGANGSMLIANSAAALGLNWANNPTITGGTIDGAPIGGSAAAAITGTTIVAKSDATTNPGQIVVEGASNPNQQLLIGYNTTSDYGSIEAIVQAVGFKPLVLCGGGGSLGIGAVFSPGEKVEVGGNVKANHIVGRTSAPTAAVGAAAGTGASITSPVAGTDMAGLISVTTGTATLAGGVLCTISFNVAYGTAPNVVLFPANPNAADVLSGASSVYVTTGTGSFVVNTGTTAPTISKNYQWYYLVCQ